MRTVRKYSKLTVTAKQAPDQAHGSVGTLGEHRLQGDTAPEVNVSVGSMPTDACRALVEGVQAFGQNLVKQRHKQVPSEAEYTRH